MISTKKAKEQGVLAAVVPRDRSEDEVKEQLDELSFLALTAGVVTRDVVIQRLDKPDIKTLMGKGKLADLASFVEDNQVDLVIFDNELHPSQARNLEQLLNCKIIDRSLLILDIFSLRARTTQSRTQVELAQYEYLLPRLTNMWTHLSKQKGGIGMKGPGETELETDRRIVRNKISLLKKKLARIDRQSIIQRKQRERMVRLALVGYTNVGKSTLMRKLAKSDAFAEDKLFATVDSTVRKVVLDQIPFLLTDTVGFIRNLPHSLIESFKSTLDEVREADILLHVVDYSHPAYEEQLQVVNQTLAEIGSADKPTLFVYNKIDKLNLNADEHKVGFYPVHTTPFVPGNHIFVSAGTNLNLDKLRDRLIRVVSKKFYTIYPNYLHYRQLRD